MATLTPHLMALSGAICSALATILIRQGLQYGNFYVGFWINVVVGVEWPSTRLTATMSAPDANISEAAE